MAFYIVIEHLDEVCRRCAYLDLELPYDLLAVDVEALIMKISEMRVPSLNPGCVWVPVSITS